MNDGLLGHRIDYLDTRCPTTLSPWVAKVDCREFFAFSASVGRITIRLNKFHRAICVILLLDIVVVLFFRLAVRNELLPSVCTNSVVVALNDVEDTLLVVAYHLSWRVLERYIFISRVVR